MIVMVGLCNAQSGTRRYGETSRGKYMSEENQNDVSGEAVDLLHKAYGQLKEQINKVIVGQDDVIEQLLIALFSQGHVLLEGVPGLAKTLMVSTLARSLSMNFSRIQFTPDLMPADITGTDILQENKSTGAREFRFIQGPLFHNVVLADEINRTPPKTQAALAGSDAGTTGHSRPDHSQTQLHHSLCWRLRTRLSRKGPTTLPEAQQDRFMFKVFVKYPDVRRRATDCSSDDVQL
jgi:MoxR-like ATPase